MCVTSSATGGIQRATPLAPDATAKDKFKAMTSGTGTVFGALTDKKPGTGLATFGKIAK